VNNDFNQDQLVATVMLLLLMVRANSFCQIFAEAVEPRPGNSQLAVRYLFNPLEASTVRDLHL
jgi:hypothetical protein